MSNLQQLQDTLGHTYTNQDFLLTALTHRSYLNESTDIKESYERMEFLGDAVLELVTSNFLYHQFPDIPEGKLTSLRSKIVQTRTLAAVARKLNLGAYLRLSRGEAASGGSSNSSLLADLVEAVIGSIYLDQGIEAATQFISTFILADYKTLIAKAQVEDWKSKLQELVQARGGVAPTYEVIAQQGPDHDRIFTVEVHFFDKAQTQGKGKSKQTAQQDAAKKAVESLG